MVKPCGCNKRRYLSYTMALANLLHQSGKGAPPLSIYQCPTKTGWHLTKRPQKGPS